LYTEICNKVQSMLFLHMQATLVVKAVQQ